MILMIAHLLGAVFLLALALRFDLVGRVRADFAPMFDGVSDWALGMCLGLVIALWSPLALGASLVAAALYISGMDIAETDYEGDGSAASTPHRELKTPIVKMGFGEEPERDLRRIRVDRREVDRTILRQINGVDQ